MKNDSILPFRPRKLIRLADMIQLCANTILGVVVLMEDMTHNAYKEAVRLSGNVAGKAQRGEIVTKLEMIEPQIKKFELGKTEHRLALFKQKLERSDYDCPYLIIHSDFKEIWTMLLGELKERKFVFIPSENVEFFEQEKLFGDAVFDVFQNARDDIKNAGNSLAADLPDAAGFYLMRVVEFGLLELARKEKVKIPKTPLDYAGWKDVVKGIDDKLSAKMPKARGAKQSAALKFKHDLLADFRAFEVARNEIMHGRSRYNKPDAIGLFNRVRGFMQMLAVKI